MPLACNYSHEWFRLAATNPWVLRVVALRVGDVDLTILAVLSEPKPFLVEQPPEHLLWSSRTYQPRDRQN